MSIRLKLLSCFSVLLCMLLFVVGLGVRSSIDHERNIRSLYENNVKATVSLAECQNAMWRLRFDLSQFISADAAARQNIVAGQPALHKSVEDAVAKFEKGALSEDEKAALKDFKDIYAQYAAARPKWFQLSLEGKTQEAAEWRAKTTFPFGTQTVANLNKLIQLQQKEASHALDQATSSARTSRNLTLASAVLALLLAAAVGAYITASITTPLADTASALRDIAEGEGDLTRRLKASRKDEIGELAFAFNLFAERVQGTVKGVSSATRQVLTSAEAVHTSAEEIAAGAESVSMQVSTMTSAVEEMVATSADIANNCCQVADSSKRASRSAQSGRTVVQGTVEGMEQIAKRVKETARAVEQLGVRSDQIGEIVGTIEDIADQTNLLALNAAIEAARAGEQGRGFAVVADEVRALAERTTRATREIGEMIKSIQAETREAVGAMDQGVREVERGSSEAARSGLALQEILDQISSVTDQVNQIATAAEEQTVTVATLGSGIQTIFDTVSGTSNGASRTSAAAAEMTALANDLQHQVRQFNF